MLVNIPEDIALPKYSGISHSVQTNNGQSVVEIKGVDNVVLYEIFLHDEDACKADPSPHICRGVYDMEEASGIVSLQSIDEPSLEPYPILVGFDALVVKGEPYSVIYLECQDHSWGMALGHMGQPVVAESPRGSHAYYLGPMGFRLIG